VIPCNLFFLYLLTVALGGWFPIAEVLVTYLMILHLGERLIYEAEHSDSTKTPAGEVAQPT
jgi:hypothetical protein